MTKRILAALVLGLLATAILLPNTACRRLTGSNTNIPQIEGAGNLDVLL